MRISYLHLHDSPMYQVELGVGEIGKIRKIAGCGKLLKNVILEAVGCGNNHGDFCRLT